MEIAITIFIMLPSAMAWFLTWHRERKAIALVLFLTNVLIIAAGALRLLEFHGVIASDAAGAVVWFFALGIAIMQFGLSRGWFVEPERERQKGTQATTTAKTTQNV